MTWTLSENTLGTAARLYDQRRGVLRYNVLGSGVESSVAGSVLVIVFMTQEPHLPPTARRVQLDPIPAHRVWIVCHGPLHL